MSSTETVTPNGGNWKVSLTATHVVWLQNGLFWFFVCNFGHLSFCWPLTGSGITTRALSKRQPKRVFMRDSLVLTSRESGLNWPLRLLQRGVSLSLSPASSRAGSGRSCSSCSETSRLNCAATVRCESCRSTLRDTRLFSILVHLFKVSPHLLILQADSTSSDPPENPTVARETLLPPPPERHSDVTVSADCDRSTSPSSLVIDLTGPERTAAKSARSSVPHSTTDPAQHATSAPPPPPRKNAQRPGAVDSTSEIRHTSTLQQTRTNAGIVQRYGPGHFTKIVWRKI